MCESVNFATNYTGLVTQSVLQSPHIGPYLFWHDGTSPAMARPKERDATDRLGTGAGMILIKWPATSKPIRIVCEWVEWFPEEFELSCASARVTNASGNETIRIVNRDMASE